MSRQLKADITGAVRALAEGSGATLSGIAAQTELITLEFAIAQATGDDSTQPSLDDVASAIALSLGTAADSLDQDPQNGRPPNRAKAARAALALLPGMQDRPLRGRRNRPGRVPAVAYWHACEPESLFKMRVDGKSNFSALIDDVAEALVLRENAYKIEERHRAQLARRPPLESAMNINWLARFEFYYEMWSAISGFRHDLELALYQFDNGESVEADMFTRKSLYYYAKYLTQLERFQAECGGLWILPNTKTENAIADSTWLIRKPMPLGEVEESMLRLTFAKHPELAPFMHATFAEPYLQPIVRTWRNWIHACKCAKPKRARKDCKVHKTITRAALYMETLDEQWDYLADWYHLPRPGSIVDPLKAAREDLQTG